MATKKRSPKNAASQDIAEYSEMSHYEHIRNITDTYLGSDKPNELDEFLLEFTEDPPVIKRGKITIAEAVVRTFIEILSNAGDNVVRSHEKKVDAGAIRVMFDGKNISVENGGLCIPVKKKKGDTEYISEKIFGKLLTSSNYDPSKPRMGCGRNGYGSKLCNIFSDSFTTEIFNASEGLSLIQTWKNKMLEKGEAIVEPYTGKESVVRITYLLDFDRFGITQYPENTDKLFARFVADFALSCKIPVYFNNIRLPFDDITTYGRVNLNLEENIEHFLFEAKEGYDPNMPRASFELFLAFTPDESRVFSFVNGMMTTSGGVHVNALWKAIGAPVLEYMNNKDKEIRMSVQDVIPHFSFVFNTRLPDPKFGSQTKNSLSDPQPLLRFSPGFIKKIMGSGIIERMENTLEAKQKRKSKMTDGKKKKHVTVTKGQDANDAGSSMSNTCVLEIVEGESAEGYVQTMRAMIPNGHDKIGVYPLMGKFMNYTSLDGKFYSDKLNNNREYCDLKMLSGLKDGLDYSIEENRETLRYGKFRFRTDADGDGKHITGLMIALFGLRYTDLIINGMIEQAYTPIKRAYKGTKQISFLTDDEFNKWASVTPDHKSWKIKYFKGLGTSTRDDVRDDIKNSCNIEFEWDADAKETIMKAFHRNRTQDRKKWMSEAKHRLSLTGSDETISSAIPLRQKKSQSVTNFIDNEMIYYPLSSVIRAIPKMTDGLKESQRKLMWAGIVRWSVDNNPTHGYKKTMDEVKVAQFAAYASEFTNFHHNEDIMGTTTKTMAMGFPGARNMPYFKACGQFGTRNQGGKDAASARYLFTTLEWWIPYVFKTEDVPFLEMKYDEGQKIEPVTLLPIIPMALVNGALGIATGFSTFIPNHNPMEIVDKLLARIEQNIKPDELTPWYKGFEGKITIETGTRKTFSIDEDESESVVLDESDAESDTSCYDYGDLGLSSASNNLFISSHTKRVMITEGIVRINTHNNNMYIDELPIGLWNQNYYDFLCKLRERHSIRDVRETSGLDKASFEIINARSLKTTQLRLKRSFGLNNMILLGPNNFPLIYKDAVSILNAFYEFRIKIYQERKRYYIEDISKQLAKFRDKKKIIMLIVEKKIIAVGRDEQAVVEEFRKHGVENPEIYTQLSFKQMTLEHIEKIQKQEDDILVELNFYKANSANDLWRIDLLNFKDAYLKHTS